MKATSIPRLITRTENLGNGTFKTEVSMLVLNPELVLISCTLAIIWTLGLLAAGVFAGIAGPAIIAISSSIVVLVKPLVPTWVRGPIISEQTFLVPQTHGYIDIPEDLALKWKLWELHKS